MAALWNYSPIAILSAMDRIYSSMISPIRRATFVIDAYQRQEQSRYRNYVGYFPQPTNEAKLAVCSTVLYAQHLRSVQLFPVVSSVPSHPKFNEV